VRNDRRTGSEGLFGKLISYLSKHVDILGSILRFLLTLPLPLPRTSSGYRVKTAWRVFNPALAISSHLLIKVLKSKKVSDTCVDVGTGTGILALEMAMLGNYVIACDINIKAGKIAVINAKKCNLYDRIDVVIGDGVEFLRSKSVNVIIMNPPYIPCHRKNYLDPVCCGNKCETLENLLKETLRTLKPEGILIFTFSTFTPLDSVMPVECSVYLLAYVRTFIDTIYVAQLSKSKKSTILNTTYGDPMKTVARTDK